MLEAICQYKKKVICIIYISKTVCMIYKFTFTPMCFNLITFTIHLTINNIKINFV